METLVEFAVNWLPVAILWIATFVILHWIVKPSTIVERIVAMFLAAVLLFYYETLITEWSSKTDVPFDPFDFANNATYIVAASLFNAKVFAFNLIPEFDGIEVFSRQFLRLEVDYDWSVTWWPITILLLGVVTRVGVSKYVKRERLKEITNEYWFFITTYLIFAVTFSSYTNWAFIGLLFLLIVIILIFVTDFRTIIGHIFVAFGAVLLELGRLLKVGWMTIAYMASQIAKTLRHFSEFIRSLYNRWVVTPIRKIWSRFVGFIDRAERWIQKKLAEQDEIN